LTRYCRTDQGDVPDTICKAKSGGEIGPTEEVLTANPQLAKHGPRLPAGLQIWLPDLLPAVSVAVRLRD